MKPILLLTLWIVALSTAYAGDNPDIVIKGNVGEHRTAGAGETVYQHVEMPEGKKSWPAVTDARTVTVPAKEMKEWVGEVPTDLLIGELARRGITIGKRGTSACGKPGGSVGSVATQASKQKPSVSKPTSNKPPPKPTKEPGKSH